MARVDSGPDDPVTRPSLTSGFAVVIEHEHDIRAATTGYLADQDAWRSDALERLLRQQQTQVAANIALLKQRYEMLPHPERFQALHQTLPRLSKSRGKTETRERASPLTALITEHVRLLESIDRLIARGREQHHAEHLLAEVARNHEEMAWELTALRGDVASVGEHGVG
ncbi:MAG TPA: hypothetical protein VM029_05560 [Opitutaceae bacterium]|nr:hypothetical protein [Opitutaceae bacterium]